MCIPGSSNEYDTAYFTQCPFSLEWIDYKQTSCDLSVTMIKLSDFNERISDRIVYQSSLRHTHTQNVTLLPV